MCTFRNSYTIQAVLWLSWMFLTQDMQGGGNATDSLHENDSGQEMGNEGSHETRTLDLLEIPEGGGLQIVAGIGIYQQAAVIRLKVLEDQRIEGGYIYLKHRKILELEGRKNGEFFDLTESHGGKVTGYLRINPMHPKLLKWIDPSKTRSEAFSVHHMEVLSREKSVNPLVVQSFDRDHPIDLLNGNNWERVNVTDDVDVLLLEDGSEMFLNMHVVATNAHMGAFTGLLKMDGAKSYQHRSTDCKIDARLMSVGVLTIQEDCRSCCGARATLSGSFPLKGAEKYELLQFESVNGRD